MALRHASMLETNEFLVLDYVRQQGETTRPEIARALGLSPSSVSRIVRRLLVEDIVREGPGERGVGRPRTAISFNTRAGCVIGVDLGGTKCHGVLADLAGTILSEDTRPTMQEGAPFPTLVGVIGTLTDRAAELGIPLSALAVGVPSVVDPRSGLALGGPNVGWDGFPIVRELSAATSVPFVIENDVNLAALAHAWRGSGRGRSDFVTLAIGTGIGAAVVADGHLVRGRNGAAGEVGFLVLERSQLREPRGRGLGALERLASGPAIAERGRRILAAVSKAEKGSAGEEPSAQRVFAAARDGNVDARALIGELIDHVAMTVIALSVVVDPEVIVLEGSVGQALEPFLAQLMERTAEQLPDPPRVEVSRLGGDATALGAVAAALQLARHQRAPESFVDSGFARGPAPDPRLDVA